MGYKRYACTVKWDRRKHRYVASIKQYPNVFVFGDTVQEAQAKMDAKLRELAQGSDDGKSQDR